MGVIDWLRQPEYTGANRCTPCTVVNLIIALGIGAVTTVVSPVAGAAVVGASLAVIYFRGYLVPGTPTLTERYLPAAVLKWFGKRSASRESTGFDGGSRRVEEMDDGEYHSPADGAFDVHNYLIAGGLVEPCADEDDLCLVEGFADSWYESMSAIDGEHVTAENLATALDLDLDERTYRIETFDNARAMRAGPETLGKWPSTEAMVADLAGARVLSEWQVKWSELDPPTKGTVLNGLRLFLERCPEGGGVTTRQDSVESCCSTQDVAVLECENSGARLFEQPIDG